MGREDKYVGDGGTVNWGALAKASGASLLLLAFQGVQNQITTAADAAGYLLGVAQGAIATVISALFGIPTGVLESGAASTIAWMPLFGPFAFIVGIGITMLAVWIATRVVSGG